MNKNIRSRFFLNSLASLGFTSLVAGPAWSQSQGLDQVPGLTEVQQPTATAIQTLCPPLAASNAVTAEQQRLLFSCSRMVVTALAQQGLKNPSLLSQFNLGITPEQLRKGIQDVAPVQMNAQQRNSIELAGRSPIAGRLLALRGGGRGMLLAGSELNLDGRVLRAEDVFGPNAKGGGASADSVAGSWGGFVNGNYNTGDRSGSAREDAFDFRDKGITAGVDYRFNDALVGGVALSYSKIDSDFTDNLGSVNSRNKAVSLYGSYAQGDWYIDGHVSYAKLDYDSARRIFIPSNTSVAPIDSTANGNTEGRQTTATVGTGLDLRRDSFSITPYARLEYLKLKLDGFTESDPVSGLGLTVRGRDTESLQSALGARVAKAISTSFGVVTPHFAAEWNHEFKNDGGSVVAKYALDPLNTFFAIPTDAPDRNYYTLSIGAAAVFAKGVSAFFNVDSTQGLARTTNTSVTLGVRGEF